MSDDRGMMKYIPYQSLTEQSSYLARMRYEKGKQEKPPMFPERKEAINDLLYHYHGQEVILTYHRDGYLHTLDGFIERIHPEAKALILSNEDIYFKEIVDLVNKDQDEFFFD